MTLVSQEDPLSLPQMKLCACFSSLIHAPAFQTPLRLQKPWFACASVSVCLPPTQLLPQGLGREDASGRAGGLFADAAFPSFSWEGIVACCRRVGGSSHAPFPPPGCSLSYRSLVPLFPGGQQGVADSLGDGAGRSEQSSLPVPTGRRTPANLETGTPEGMCTGEQPNLF